MRLPANDDIYHHPAKTVVSNYEKETLNSFEGNEGQTIGNLLPDEDDLFSGMTDVLVHGGQANSGDELEDFDLFSNGGGLELGEDPLSAVHQKYNLFGGVLNYQVGCNGSIAGEHPSRTLFVRNISGSIEDSELKALFEVLIPLYPLQLSHINLPCLLTCRVFFLLSEIRRYTDSVHSLQAPWFCYDLLLRYKGCSKCNEGTSK